MKNTKAFTLVELLVVIAILGILASIILVSLGGARANARDVKRVAEAKEVANLLEAYYLDKGNYPVYTDTSDPASNWAYMLQELQSSGYLTANQDIKENKLSWIKNIIGETVQALAAVVVEPIIKDPLYPDRKYEYMSDDSGTNYRIRAHFENASNPILTSSLNGKFADQNQTGDTACDSALSYYCIGPDTTFTPPGQ